MSLAPGDKEKKKSRRLSRMYLEEGSAEGLEKKLQKQAVEEKKKKKSDFTPPPRIGYEDMTKMEDMTLEAVLSNLQERYEANQIYVRTNRCMLAGHLYSRVSLHTDVHCFYSSGHQPVQAPPSVWAAVGQVLQGQAPGIGSSAYLRCRRGIVQCDGGPQAQPVCAGEVRGDVSGGAWGPSLNFA